MTRRIRSIVLIALAIAIPITAAPVAVADVTPTVQPLCPMSEGLQQMNYNNTAEAALLVRPSSCGVSA